MPITTETGEINRSVLSYIISGDGSPQDEVSESKTKLLIVDDERESAEEIAELLTFDSFMECEITDDPFKAMDIVETDQDVSIIITDLKMPGLNGLQLIKKLLDRYNNNRDFAVIVVTGHAGTKEAIKALQLGVMGFITKPISPDHLLHAVGRADETLQLRKLEKRLHEHLVHNVEARTQEVRLLSDDLLRAKRNLHSLNQSVSASNKIKSEFLSMLGHGLRTPLTPILGFAELIAITSSEKGDMEQHRYSKTISAEGFKLLRVINSMLDLVEVDSGDLQLNIAEINMVDVVDHVIDLLKPQAELSSITLTSSVAKTLVPMIQGDEKRLMQAMYNIVDNSIRYSPSDTNVVVEVSSLGEELNISVSDNGVGMNEVEVMAAREAFSQIESRVKRGSDGIGFGTGLAFANISIELHGGKMDISSRKGEGTMVKIVIPSQSALPCPS
jgi:signal transduction histidine kinase